MANKKQPDMKYSKIILPYISKECDIKRQDYIEIDKKILQFIILQSTLLTLFVKLIKLPESTYGIAFYDVVILLSLISLGFLLYHYIPKSFKSICPKGIYDNYYSKGEGGFIDFLTKVPNGYIKTYKDLENIINRKDFLLRIIYSVYLTCLVIAIFMIILEGI